MDRNGPRKLAFSIHKTLDKSYRTLEYVNNLHAVMNVLVPDPSEPSVCRATPATESHCSQATGGRGGCGPRGGRGRGRK